MSCSTVELDIWYMMCEYAKIVALIPFAILAYTTSNMLVRVIGISVVVNGILCHLSRATCIAFASPCTTWDICWNVLFCAFVNLTTCCNRARCCLHAQRCSCSFTIAAYHPERQKLVFSTSCACNGPFSRV